jgi:hypothetical protein
MKGKNDNHRNNKWNSDPERRIFEYARHHAITPNIRPTPAVSDIARAPQNVTLIAPNAIGAPPALAAIPTRRARKTNEDTATTEISWLPGTTYAAANGSAEPMVNVPAEEQVIETDSLEYSFKENSPQQAQFTMVSLLLMV